MRLEKLVRTILSKIQENFCKELDFGIRTHVLIFKSRDYKKPFFVISISNLLIPFLIFLIIFNGFSQETIFKTSGVINQEAASHHNQIQYGTLIQEFASQKVQSSLF